MNINKYQTSITLAILASLAISCTIPGSHDDDSDRLYVLTSSIWEDSSINVCWENPTGETEEQRQWVRDAAMNSWGAVSSVDFTGWETCSPGEPGIHILIDDAWPHVQALGNGLDGLTNGMLLNFTFQNWAESCQSKTESCIRTIAVHEFGHALGFAHEQNRSDTPDTCDEDPQGSNGDLEIGEWDLHSVMNYCNPVWSGDGQLSATDIYGVQQMYGGATPLGVLDIADVDGDGRDEVFSRDVGSAWAQLLYGTPATGLESCWSTFGWFNPPGEEGESGWAMQSGDQYYAADINGDGAQEWILHSPNGEWLGVLFGVNGELRLGSLEHIWVNHPGQEGANGWHLSAGDRFYPADLDGDGNAELIVHSPDGQWLGTLSWQDDRLRATAIEHDWINHPGQAGANGWNLSIGDRFYPADLDGDGDTELVVHSPDGQWLGTLSWQGDQLRATSIEYTWINHPGQEGANGWHLSAGDRFYPADLDGDGDMELVVHSPDGQWLGTLSWQDDQLWTAAIEYVWVNHPGQEGANGWHLSGGDMFTVADLDGNGTDELVVRSPDGQWIGTLTWQDDQFRATAIEHVWVNHPGQEGANGWHLSAGDRVHPGDIDGDGKDELIITSPDHRWIATIRGTVGGLEVPWIAYANESPALFVDSCEDIWGDGPTGTDSGASTDSGADSTTGDGEESGSTSLDPSDDGAQDSVSPPSGESSSSSGGTGATADDSASDGCSCRTGHGRGGTGTLILLGVLGLLRRREASSKT